MLRPLNPCHLCGEYHARTFVWRGKERDWHAMHHMGVQPSRSTAEPRRIVLRQPERPFYKGGVR